MNDPKLLVLGAGRHQAALIRRAEARGIHTIALDPYEDAPGKQVARTSVLADAFSIEAVEQAALNHSVDALITVGTDQTVLPMAAVAARLGLPCGISHRGAERATQKDQMRQALASHDVAIATGATISANESITEAEALVLPVIVKPADSQGQRGTQIVHSSADLLAAVNEAQAHSRIGTAIIEEFVTGPEITINAWIHDGQAVVLAVTDRVTMNPPPSVGICLQHVYPSRHLAQQGESVEIAQKIAAAYELVNGPLYIQAIASDRGPIVIEAAARVGGGHELGLLPATVGVEMLDRSIDVAFGRSGDLPHPMHIAAGLVNFIVAKPGRINEFGALAANGGDVIEAGWYRAAPFDQPPVTDSMGRIGYFVLTAATRDEALTAAAARYADLVANDESGNNLIYWPDEGQLLGG